MGIYIIIILNTVKQKVSTIFLFHEVTNKPSEFQKKHKIFHTVDEFEKIIKWIKNNYNIVSPNEIFDNKNQQALITFDDGYYGSFKNGIPILNSLNIPSGSFLNCRPIIKHQLVLYQQLIIYVLIVRNLKNLLLIDQILDLAIFIK